MPVSFVPEEQEESHILGVGFCQSGFSNLPLKNSHSPASCISIAGLVKVSASTLVWKFWWTFAITFFTLLKCWLASQHWELVGVEGPGFVSIPAMTRSIWMRPEMANSSVPRLKASIVLLRILPSMIGGSLGIGVSMLSLISRPLAAVEITSTAPLAVISQREVVAMKMKRSHQNCKNTRYSPLLCHFMFVAWEIHGQPVWPPVSFWLPPPSSIFDSAPFPFSSCGSLVDIERNPSSQWRTDTAPKYCPFLPFWKDFWLKYVMRSLLLWVSAFPIVTLLSTPATIFPTLPCCWQNKENSRALQQVLPRTTISQHFETHPGQSHN